jgi:16S rRNA A1518/A1519 N6-dimethyltransferase RsmA/KsgA/DIM1 with predicted DNA glycosylase/AP lyase activity
VEEDPKNRFSNRATYYAKSRPRYPEAILNFMENELSLTKESVIADIGSGTGILSELFLRHGNSVFGVEPNREMRKAAEELLAAYPNFKSTNGTAEATTLPAASVDSHRSAIISLVRSYQSPRRILEDYETPRLGSIDLEYQEEFTRLHGGV